MITRNDFREIAHDLFGGETYVEVLERWFLERDMDATAASEMAHEYARIASQTITEVVTNGELHLIEPALCALFTSGLVMGYETCSRFSVDT